jgi:hypothetical protein
MPLISALEPLMMEWVLRRHIYSGRGKNFMEPWSVIIGLVTNLPASAVITQEEKFADMI